MAGSFTALGKGEECHGKNILRDIDSPGDQHLKQCTCVCREFYNLFILCYIFFTTDQMFAEVCTAGHLSKY